MASILTPTPTAAAVKVTRPIDRFRAAVRVVILSHRMQKDLSNWYLLQVASPAEVAVGQSIQQVGGHAATFLKLEGGRVAKIADPKEMTIYPQLCKEFPREFLPQYYGTMTDDAGKQRCVLEDLTYGYEKPCVMDIKMGTKTFEQEAGLIKKFKLGIVDAISSTNQCGARLVALSTWQPMNGRVRSIPKKEATWMSDPVQWFETFLFDGAGLRVDLVDSIIEQVTNIHRHFKIEQRWEFLGSSLLFIYDGIPAKYGNKKQPAVPKVRMIDFAHTRRLSKSTHDKGYCTGLQSILQALHVIKGQCALSKPPPVRWLGDKIHDNEHWHSATGSPTEFTLGEIVCVRRSDKSLTYGRVSGASTNEITVIVNENGNKQIPWALVPKNLAKIISSSRIFELGIKRKEAGLGFALMQFSIIEILPGGKYDKMDGVEDLRKHFAFAELGQPVATVTAGSSAERAGLKAKDVIQLVNGTDVRRMTSDAISEMLKGIDRVFLHVIRQEAGAQPCPAYCPFKPK